MGWKQFLGLEEEPSGLASEFEQACKMSYTTRLWCFGICFGLGWLISFLALFAIPQIATHPETFASLYTFGNIIALASTGFLFGPCSQLKKMIERKRIFATLLYLFAIGLTLFCAYHVKQVIPVLLALLLQFLAMLWYSLSYIPYAHTCIINSVSKTCSCV
jgi:hypothetical protein